jgi:hypothetical protein
MTPIAVFGYASLVDPQSAGATIGRPIRGAPARLPGWRRRWSLVRDNLRSEKTFAIDPGGEVPPFVLGLNVEPAPDAHAAVNGVLIEVDRAELERLDLREVRYDRVDVTELIDADHGFETVITYVAKEAHFRAEPPDGAVILNHYTTTVRAGFARLGQAELEAFFESTDPHPVRVVDGVLIRDEIPSGNPRLW